MTTGQLWPAGGGGGGGDLPADVLTRLLPTDGEVGQVLERSGGVLVGSWGDPPALGKYRGTWGAMQLLKLYDLTTVAPFVGVGSSFRAPTVGAVATHGGANKPGFQNFIRGAPASGSSGHTGGFSLALPEENLGATVLQVKFWQSTDPRGGNAGTGAVGEFLENGLTRWTGPDVEGPTAWAELTINTTGSSPLIWRARNVANIIADSRIDVCGIRLFGSSAPYMAGDTVDHLGSFYRSEINNNPNTPGADASWTLIVT